MTPKFRRSENNSRVIVVSCMSEIWTLLQREIEILPTKGYAFEVKSSQFIFCNIEHNIKVVVRACYGAYFVRMFLNIWRQILFPGDAAL